MKELKDYYVYQLNYRGAPLYVGYGRGDRINHVLSGVSHNKALNTFVAFGFNEKEISLEKVLSNLTDKQARNIESALIDNLKPLFNIKGGNSSALKVAEYLCVHKHFRQDQWGYIPLDQIIASHSDVEY